MKLVIIAVAILVVVGIAAGVYFFYPSPLTSKKTSAQSFEDCQAAGHLVVDTKPRECHTKARQVFIEVYNGAIVESVIQVTEPIPNQVVTSPFKLEGKAVGGWYFNDQLTARLEDANGKVITTKPLKALSTTKTNNFVPFVAAITFKDEDITAATGTARLIIEKANTTYKGESTPLIIPVRFK